MANEFNKHSGECFFSFGISRLITVNSWFFRLVYLSECWQTLKIALKRVKKLCHLHRKHRPWFVNTICADLHPKTVDIQRVEYIKWHRMPKYRRLYRMALFSILPAISNRAYQQNQTMLVDRPSLQWLIQNRLISPLHLSVCLPTIDFRALNRDAPHHLYGNDSPIQESVECNAMHRLPNKIHEQQCLQIVRHQWLYFGQQQRSREVNVR